MHTVQLSGARHSLVGSRPQWQLAGRSEWQDSSLHCAQRQAACLPHVWALGRGNQAGSAIAYSQLLVILRGHLVARGGRAGRASGTCFPQTGHARETRSFQVCTRRPHPPPLLASTFAYMAQQACGRWTSGCWCPFLFALSPARYPGHVHHPKQGHPLAIDRPSPLGPAFLLRRRQPKAHHSAQLISKAGLCAASSL